METASITFITGGVRSGKSSFAEKTAMERARKTNGSLHYVATAKVTDSEMEGRIARHRKDRKRSGYSWKTWEQEANIEALSSQFTKNDIILLDCVTTLLSNELFAHELDMAAYELEKEKVFQRIWDGIIAIGRNSKHLILVSNEVLNEPIFPSELLMIYSELLGKLHQKIVRVAEDAYLVEAGVPMLMKGGQS